MKTALRVVAVASALLAPFASHAHKMWLLPSATVSTVDQWITVDAAVSNDLFYFNHVPLRLDNLAITAPDGTKVTAENAHTGKYRSVFDVQLKQNGTYKVALVNQGLFASYEENGARKRWRGTAARFANEVPADAKNLEVSESVGRVETFVTAGKPTEAALKPANVGLELLPLSHPNDLYAGETSKFRFLLDGKPAANLQVVVQPGGTRYRNEQQEQQLKTDANGELSIDWPTPGMYWLETTMQDQKTSLKQAKQRRLSYVATFEVLPQ
ncbi:DUF4198 domain-containing protein [Steroidobacter sp. S1-65]|uniref:DUF4198 domain-containing protein n=1 Tax=Steroidobacter gossypii TaxID=2805490 RepID=A0ABS1X4Y3_9GAMM|nr:DUF4198 domain-containing protein [Steroidobacter gossypii]MBM0108290.1 DUF4198 domain-containing protein [Steroidobacter gossypii]